ncbi:cytokinin riboside 5'-monophosphate phosphoribohydrolase [Elysia marginata]|uniref:Cytokinin riboside 5'-monophosphate phosphoribohydrolase n=1 Tax=Elysia marginata TaxID=1093978 RepID=A0AAV4G508_9GAST|nr:cytokinin riboside 5'-monophosphate phosphoribohydrolase [Elysia marginata]
MSNLGPCVSIFGSTRAGEDSSHYDLGMEIARKVGQSGYGIITGGGEGLMEAANKGANISGVSSVGLNINLPDEQNVNKFVDGDKLLNFEYFFVRKVMFVRYAQAIIILPGGFGTMDELFEILTLIQTKRVKQVPIVLVGKVFWSPLLDWIKKVVLDKFNYISEADMKLFSITDSPNEVVEIIDDFHKEGRFSFNF